MNATTDSYCETAVAVDGLRVTTTDGRQTIVDNVSFKVAAGEILGVVGESGSGKTTLGLALLNHCRRGLRVEAGSVRIGGQNLRALSTAKLKRLRGQLVCYMPQNPATALNPALRIRTQLAECFSGAHPSEDDLFRLLEQVKLPPSSGFLDALPHQLSGGQIQRVALAMAFVNRPRLIVMDEPTTGLDVTTQAHVLNTVKQLCSEHNVAVVYISHDIAVVAAIAARTAVMYAGRMVEIGATDRVMQIPAHPYTRALINSVPDLDSERAVVGIPGHAPQPVRKRSNCAFAARCQFVMDKCRRELPPEVTLTPNHMAACFSAEARPFTSDRSIGGVETISGNCSTIVRVANLRAYHHHLEVLHGLSFEIEAGDCVGLVGESGSGKTTLARCLAGLHANLQGTMEYSGQPLRAGVRERSQQIRQRIQYIFQNPHGSLNPRRSVGESIAMVLRQFSDDRGVDVRARVEGAMNRVSLPARLVDSFPHQLSGGQLQRVAIARALVAEPNLLICDEVTSALDVSVQAAILELLAKLRVEDGLTMLFVTHNLGVVRNIAQKILVMEHGTIVEAGRMNDVLLNPRSEVTQNLLRDAPRFSVESSPHATANVISEGRLTNET